MHRWLSTCVLCAGLFLHDAALAVQPAGAASSHEALDEAAAARFAQLALACLQQGHPKKMSHVFSDRILRERSHRYPTGRPSAPGLPSRTSLRFVHQSSFLRNSIHPCC